MPQDVWRAGSWLTPTDARRHLNGYPNETLPDSTRFCFERRCGQDIMVRVGCLIIFHGAPRLRFANGEFPLVGTASGLGIRASAQRPPNSPPHEQGAVFAASETFTAG